MMDQTTLIQPASVPSSNKYNPAISLIWYLMLIVVIIWLPTGLLRAVLASIVVYLTSGYSLTAIFFPYRYELNMVERLTFAAILSLAVNGIISFVLSRSIWGLSLVSFLIGSGIFNLLCFMILLYQRRNEPPQTRSYHPTFIASFFNWVKKQSFLNHLVSFALLSVLISGLWVFTQSTLAIPARHQMIEFFLLAPDDLIEGYNKTAILGEPIQIHYGVSNLENQKVEFEVRAEIDGVVAGQTPRIKLNPGVSRYGRLSFEILDFTEGFKKVEFILFQDETPIRNLHVWMEIRLPEQTNISYIPVFTTPTNHVE